MLTTLRYHKVCAWWVPRLLTQEQTTQYKGFRTCWITTGLKTTATCITSSPVTRRRVTITIQNKKNESSLLDWIFMNATYRLTHLWQLWIYGKLVLTNSGIVLPVLNSSALPNDNRWSYGSPTLYSMIIVQHFFFCRPIQQIRRAFLAWKNNYFFFSFIHNTRVHRWGRVSMDGKIMYSLLHMCVSGHFKSNKMFNYFPALSDHMTS